MNKQEEEKQFEKLVLEHESLVYKICRMYAYTDVDREDLFQEIVIQAWKSYPRFKGDSKFSTWLYRVGLNTAITGLRKKKTFITAYDPADLPLNISDNNSGQEQEEQSIQLQIAIEQLNPLEKAIVMLYLEDRSYEEMEAILGVNQANLRVKMNRIKDKLRKITKNN